MAGEDALITKVVSKGNNEIAISNNFPGDIATLDCGNHQYKINDGSFLAADGNTNIHLTHQKLSNALFAHTGGFFIAETDGTGQVLVSSFGSIYTMELTGGQLTIDNDHVIAWDSSLDYDIYMEGGMLGSTWNGEGLVNSFSGYGKVYLQSLNLTNFTQVMGKRLGIIKN